MKYFCISVILIFIFTKVNAQEKDSTALLELTPLDTVEVDSIAEPPPYDLGFYLLGEARYAPHYLGSNFNTALGIGFQYNRWQAGFLAVDFAGLNQEFVVFPRTFSLDYRYGGPFFGFEFWRNEHLSLQGVTSLCYGDMIWDENAAPILERDEFWLLHLSGQLMVEKFRYFKPYAKLSYQKTYGLDLQLIQNSDFDGFVFLFGIQIGYFNQ
ncbi:MAG: hypothetical protein AAF616_06355 [Bacteroidota bacterium]